MFDILNLACKEWGLMKQVIKEEGKMLGLRDCLQYLEAHHPEEVVRVSEPIDPKECDHAAWQELLAKRRAYPWVIFDKAKNWQNETWQTDYEL